MVLYDLKLMDPTKHEEYTGVPIDRVLTNARIINESKKPVWIRTPIIPEHTDDEDNIRAIARFILDNMDSVERYDLLAFNRMCIDKYALFDLEYPLKDYDLMTEETMEHLAQVARDEGLSNVVWSGMTKNSKKEEPVDQEVKTCG
jgi:pyruvate formate lyase activating enzyme